MIHGDARGADRIAGEIAANLGLAVRECPARWEEIGASAGRVRNRFMLDLKPDKVIAFTRSLSDSRGTLHMVKIARAAGVPVEVIGE